MKCSLCGHHKSICGATMYQSSGLALQCTRPRAHAGKHSACGASSDPGMHPIVKWSGVDPSGNPIGAEWNDGKGGLK